MILAFFQILVFPFLILTAVLVIIQVGLLILIKKGKIKRFRHFIEDPDKMYQLVAMIFVIIAIIYWIWNGTGVENSGF